MQYGAEALAPESSRRLRGTRYGSSREPTCSSRSRRWRCAMRCKSPAGAQAFATGLYDFFTGRGSDETGSRRWCEAVADLPRRQTRVLTWPLVTVFGFIAEPDTHIFLKPTVTRVAAKTYGFDFQYAVAAELGRRTRACSSSPRPCGGTRATCSPGT